MLFYPRIPINLNNIAWKKPSRILPHNYYDLNLLYFIKGNKNPTLHKILTNTENRQKNIKISNDDIKNSVDKVLPTIKTTKDVLKNKDMYIDEGIFEEENIVSKETEEVINFIENNYCDIKINWRNIPQELTKYFYLTYKVLSNLDEKYIRLMFDNEFKMLGYIMYCVRCHGFLQEKPYEANVLNFYWKNDGIWSCSVVSQKYYANKNNLAELTVRNSFSDMQKMGLFNSRQLPTGIRVNNTYSLIRRPKCYWLQYPIFKALIKTYHTKYPNAFLINKIENMEEYYEKMETMQKQSRERQKEREESGINYETLSKKYEITIYEDDPKKKSIKNYKDFKTKLNYMEQKIFIDQFKRDIDLTEKPIYDRENHTKEEEIEFLKTTDFDILRVQKNPTETPEQIRQKLYILDEYKRGNIRGIMYSKTITSKPNNRIKKIRKDPEGYYFTIDNILPFIIKNKKLPFDCTKKVPIKLRRKYQEQFLAILWSARINVFDPRNYSIIRQAMNYFYACYENYIEPEESYKKKNWKNRDVHVMFCIIEHMFGNWIIPYFHIQNLIAIYYSNIFGENVIDSYIYNDLFKVNDSLFLAGELFSEMKKVNSTTNIDTYIDSLWQNLYKLMSKKHALSSCIKDYNICIYNIYAKLYEFINMYLNHNLLFGYYNNFNNSNNLNKHTISLLDYNLIESSSLFFSNKKKENIKKPTLPNTKISLNFYEFPYFKNRNKYSIQSFSYNESISNHKEKIFKSPNVKHTKLERVNRFAHFPLYQEENLAKRFAFLTLDACWGRGQGAGDTIVEGFSETLLVPGKFHIPGKLFEECSPVHDNFSVENFSGFKTQTEIPEYSGRMSALIFSDFIHNYLKNLYKIESGIYSQYEWYDPSFKIFLEKSKDFLELRNKFIYPKIGIMRNFYDLQNIYFDYINQKKENKFYKFEDPDHESKIKLYLKLKHMLKNAEYTPVYRFFDLIEYLESIFTPERVQFEQEQDTWINFLLKLEFSGIFGIHPDFINMFPHQDLFENHFLKISLS